MNRSDRRSERKVTFPFFTIITATHNAASHIPRLLDSLARQTCRDFEVIVQDGASSDETVCLIESFRDRLPALSLCSEPDKGIYDAWNKALPRIRGEWVVFLGADDALADPKVLANVRERLAGVLDEIDFAAGHGRMLFGDGTVCLDMRVDLEKSSAFFEVGCPVCHAALFYRRQLFVADRFDVRYRIAADYDFLCRHWQPERVLAVDVLVTEMLAGGVSSSAATRRMALRETMHIAKIRFGRYPRALMLSYAKSLLHGALIFVAGERLGNTLYDRLRRLNGNTPFWSKVNKL